MRRRRSQGTWLPVLGTEATIAEDTIERTTRTVSIDLVAAEIFPLTVVTPVIFDDPSEANDVSDESTLSDLVGNEYLLKRIVGKVWVQPFWRIPLTEDFASEYDDQINAVVVAAGFFIARAADGAAGVNSPIGGAGVWRTDYNPLSRNQCREPWIWRRSWLLGNPARRMYNQGQLASPTGAPLNLNVFDNAPANNSEFGSVLDGPHIDSKSKRRVGADDRLWFAMAATSFPPSTTQATGVNITGTFDVRVFGALRKAQQRGAF